MKTSDRCYPSIQSLECPLEQADTISRTTPPLQSKAKASKTLQSYHVRALPFLIGSALISSFSLLGLLGYLFIQSPTFNQPSVLPQESVR